MRRLVHGKLLDVAVREFGSKGLQGVSTREIAAAAGTAMSSITYHYGGKKGLYLAAAEHIAATMTDAMAPALACEPTPSDPEEARRCVHEVLEHILSKYVLEEDSDWSLFIMREQMNPTAAFDRLYDGPMGTMATRLAALTAAATGARDADARIAAMLLFAQAIVWRSARALAERSLRMTVAAAGDAIRSRLSANIDAILDRLSAEQQEPR